MTSDARRRLKAEKAMVALATTGSAKAAARALGIHEVTVRRHVADYCVLNGFASPVQAAYHLGLYQNVRTASFATP